MSGQELMLLERIAALLARIDEHLRDLKKVMGVPR